MGFDLVTWEPRVGDTGDDRWNWPGSLRLDGAEPTDEPHRLIAGDASGFSAIPTIAEINASSGLNQIVGLLNRRILQYNAAFGTMTQPLAYFDGDNEGSIRVTDIPGAAPAIYTLWSAIDALRVREGFGLYGWPFYPFWTFYRNFGLRGAWIAHMRKALGIYGQCWPAIIRHGIGAGTNGYYRQDSPWGTPAAEFNDLAMYPWGDQPYYIGVYNARSRSFGAFNVPPWLAGVEVEQFTAMVQQYVSFMVYRPSIGVYSSNTSDYPYSPLNPPYNGTAYRTDNLEAILPDLSQQNVRVNVDKGRLKSKAGARYSLVLASTYDVENINHDGYISLDLSYSLYPSLILDFGS